MMPKTQFASPLTVTELLETLSQINEQVVFINGGTDLVIQLQSGKLKPAWLVDLSRLAELKYIKTEDGRLKIGSGTVFGQLAESQLVQEQAKCLSQAASQVGSTQIRNRATLGGNIANASPAGDSLPALLVLEAWLSIIGPQGFRRVPFAEFQAGKGVGLAKNELIKELDCPLPEACAAVQVRSAFQKLGSRTEVSIARLNLAAWLEVDLESDTILKSRWAVGSLGPAPFRLGELETFLQGKKLSPDLGQEIAGRLTETVDRAIPGRASQGYKRQAIRGLALDIVTELFPERVV